MDHFKIQTISPSDAPMDLLLDADPSPERVQDYLWSATVFGAIVRAEVVGVLVLTEEGNSTMEIKNISLREDSRGQGAGRLLIEAAIAEVIRLGKGRLEVGTANASFGPLRFYQKCGFRMLEVWRDHFTRHYHEPIFEDGILCRDMVRLAVDL